MPRRRISYADDDKLSVGMLARMRIPPLFVGLVLGFGLSFATSRFEEVLAANVATVFFLPFIVYMASAVGSQTQTIYTRDLSRGMAKFSNYLKKETLLGLLLGALFGVLSFLVVTFWQNSIALGATVGVSMFIVVSTAPLIAMLVTEVFQLEHQDPAVDTGPIAMIIQDMTSIVVYGMVASLIMI